MLSSSLIRWFAKYERAFDVNEMHKRGFSNVDLTELVRKGFLEPHNNTDGQTERAIFRMTGRYPVFPVYTVTPKGTAAIGGQPEISKPTGISPGRLARQLGEASSTNPYDQDPDEDDEPEAGAPNGQSAPQQATPAPGVAPAAGAKPAPQPGPPTPPTPPGTPAAPSKAQPATPGQTPGQPTPVPGAPSQPSQADTNQAKQVADRIKQTGVTDPATIEREIQKSVAASGKGSDDQSAMSNLVKQQMGITN